MNWQFDPVIDKSDEIALVSHWDHNLVKITQIESYPADRPKGFIFTFLIPSPVNSPKNLSQPPNLTNNIPQIGYNHKIYVCLPRNYPAVKSVELAQPGTDTLYIESRPQLWHPRFYLQQKSWGCIMVNGEIDRIAMNLFQQLLWEPGHVWKLSEERETTNNSNASRWGQINGKEEVYKFLLNLMNEKWHVN